MKVRLGNYGPMNWYLTPSVWCNAGVALDGYRYLFFVCCWLKWGFELDLHWGHESRVTSH